MEIRFTVAVGVSLVCALLQVSAADDTADIRVYPTPKYIEMTGGSSSVKISDAKFRKEKGLGEESYRIVVGTRLITVAVSTVLRFSAGRRPISSRLHPSGTAAGAWGALRERATCRRRLIRAPGNRSRGKGKCMSVISLSLAQA